MCPQGMSGIGSDKSNTAKEAAKQGPRLRRQKASVALGIVQVAGEPIGVQPGAAVSETSKTQKIMRVAFKDSWEVANPSKHFAVCPKWPRSRPINTKSFAASCGFRGHLLECVHKACRASDLTTSQGTAIVVLSEPRFETRVVAGFPPPS